MFKTDSKSPFYTDFINHLYQDLFDYISLSLVAHLSLNYVCYVYVLIDFCLTVSLVSNIAVGQPDEFLTFKRNKTTFPYDL